MNLSGSISSTSEASLGINGFVEWEGGVGNGMWVSEGMLKKKNQVKNECIKIRNISLIRPNVPFSCKLSVKGPL